MEYSKSKCFNYQVVTECKIYVKDHKCQLCKIPRQHSRTATYIKNRRRDTFAHREENCQCVRKKYLPLVQSKKRNLPTVKNYPLNALLILISFLIINYFILIDLLDCYASRLLLV